jgi:GMP synthase-like glutamine amidotransferase
VTDGVAGGATALVVQNTVSGDLGRWAGWLAEGGLGTEVVRAYEPGARVPDELTPYAALVVLGGGFLPDEDERAPWLRPVRALVGQALTDEVPVFGICLGGQMLAQVAGGAVEGRSGEPEFGSTRLALRAEAARDPLFRDLPPRPTAIENHMDRIVRLPAGASWLVSSERCPYQAFRVGGTAWGVQFHPEAAADRLTRWDPARLTPHGLDRGALHHQALADEPESARVWREVALRFAALASGRDA